jgi:hypothetical protein
MRVVESSPATSVVEVSRAELLTINNALNEVLNGPDAIPEWEFQTRMGVTRSDARRLLEGVGEALS